MANVVTTCSCGHSMMVPGQAIGTLYTCDSCGAVVRVSKKNTKPLAAVPGAAAADLTQQASARCAKCGRPFQIPAERAGADEQLICSKCAVVESTAFETVSAADAGPVSLPTFRYTLPVIGSYKEAFRLVIQHLWLLWYLPAILVASILLAPLSLLEPPWLGLTLYLMTYTLLLVYLNLAFCKQALQVLRKQPSSFRAAFPGFWAWLNGLGAILIGALVLSFYAVLCVAPVYIGLLDGRIVGVIFLIFVVIGAGLISFSEMEFNIFHIVAAICLAGLMFGGQIAPAVPIVLCGVLFAVACLYVTVLEILMVCHIADGENVIDVWRSCGEDVRGYKHVWIGFFVLATVAALLSIPLIIGPILIAAVNQATWVILYDRARTNEQMLHARARKSDQTVQETE